LWFHISLVGEERKTAEMALDFNLKLIFGRTDRITGIQLQFYICYSMGHLDFGSAVEEDGNDIQPIFITFCNSSPLVCRKTGDGKSETRELWY
jgi:hypothetical protein